MKINIEKIEKFIPKDFVLASDLAESIGVDKSFPGNRLGTKILPRISQDQETSDLCVAAINRLFSSGAIAPEDVECLVVCTQNPDGHGLPHTSAIVQNKVGLSNSCACFDISLGCSGYVYGLSVIKGFMETAGYKRGILVTADPYSKIIDNNDKNTALLFGDASTATLMSENGCWDIVGSQFATDGSGAKELCYKDRLYMNGRQVFNFAQLSIPAQVLSVCKKFKIETSEIDRFIFHQASKHMVDTLTKRLDLDPIKVPFDIQNTGNTVSSSIPIILQGVLSNKKIRNILISGFGVGLSYATSILKKV
jgi:3-oxoacyl-[acyl-carrier-protein] synthase III